MGGDGWGLSGVVGGGMDILMVAVGPGGGLPSGVGGGWWVGGGLGNQFSDGMFKRFPDGMFKRVSRRNV